MREILSDKTRRLIGKTAKRLAAKSAMRFALCVKSEKTRISKCKEGENAAGKPQTAAFFQFTFINGFKKSLRTENAEKETMNGTVYLIHLDAPIAHARHYIGWAKWIKERIKPHRNGTGAKFLAEAVRREINFDVVRTWENTEENTDGNFERKLKNRKKARMLCPICRKEKK